jgi:hypothetical protein
LAAKNLQIDALPLLVTPHPLNDLNPEEVRELARVSYPVVLQQLCSQQPLPLDTRIDFVHPAVRRKQASAAKSGEAK